MKKRGRLFLDVRETVTKKPGFNYDAEVQRGRHLVEQIILQDKLTELRISIVSSDSIDAVAKFAKRLQKNLDGIDKIHWGHHHADCMMLHLNGLIRMDYQGKALQMINNLSVCKHDICYYADDNSLNLTLAQLLISKQYPDLKLVLFDPKGKALQGLNDAVEEYLKTR